MKIGPLQIFESEFGLVETITRNDTTNTAKPLTVRDFMLGLNKIFYGKRWTWYRHAWWAIKWAVGIGRPR